MCEGGRPKSVSKLAEYIVMSEGNWYSFSSQISQPKSNNC